MADEVEPEVLLARGTARFDPLASARAALEALEARGARAYDEPACACIETLLTRAEELGGGVAQRLLARAHEHLDALQKRFDAHGARCAARLAAYEAAHERVDALHEQLARGELTSLARRIRRLTAAGRLPMRALAFSPGRDAGRRAPDALRRRRVTVYEDSVAQMVATLALARSPRVVPADAGPYNPLRIASEVLERMRAISPFYLAVQLNRLEELGSLLELPELPESETAKTRPSTRAEADKKQKKGRPPR